MSLRALEIAYVLRKNSPRNGDAHTTYIGIFFDREKSLDDQLSPKVVGIDTAVAVEEVGSPKHWYVIEENPGSDKDALSPNDPLAKRLMGKKINDEIVQDKGKPSETKLKIMEIKSKYVHALHETMAMFPHFFGEGDNPPLKRFTVKTDPNAEEETRSQLMQVLDSTVGRDEHILRVQKLYEEGKLTIGTFANLIGRDPITIWGGLVNNPRIGIRCCAGTQGERQDAIKTVRESKTVAADLTALLTLGNIDRLNLLRDSFKEVFVAQSTIDILTQEIAQKSGLGSKGFMTVWKEGGQYFRQEVTEEDIQKQITFLQKIKDWIATNCTVAPMTEILKLPKEQRERLYETIGACFVDTMMIAKERSCPLYSDDHGTRAIAQNDFAVKGFWTQVLAIIAVEKGLITLDDLEKINVSLCEMHYRHTTISGKTLLYAAKSVGWINNGAFAKVLAGITGLSIELGSAMGVAVEFFYQLWKEPAISDLQRESLVFTALDAIAQQKNRIEVIKYAGVLIPARFRLSPVAGTHLLKLVAAWRSIRT
jgi:predicted nucleic acid-binding protein